MHSVAAEAELRNLTETLEAESDLLLAIAFGSVPAGAARFDSDIDVGVLARRPLDAERKAELIRALAAATGRPVDLLDLGETGLPLLRTVLRDGRTLFCRDRAARARLVSRMLADVEDFLPLRERLLRERRERWIG
jgi:uncharacterized protein